MSKVSVYRIENFNAAHQLHVKDWTEEKNKEIFVKCNNPLYHGHNYEIQVRVTGEVDPVTGYVIDMKILGEITREVIKEFDHKNLNLDLPEFAQLNPTAENIIIVLYDKLRAKIDANLALHLRLYETDNNFVEYPV